MAEHQLPKLRMRVRFPSSAPNTKPQVEPQPHLGLRLPSGGHPLGRALRVPLGPLIHPFLHVPEQLQRGSEVVAGHAACPPTSNQTTLPSRERSG